MLVFQNCVRLLHELPHKRRRCFSLRSCRLRGQRLGSFNLRVRVSNGLREAFAAQDEDETVLTHRLDEDLSARDLDPPQLAHDLGVAFGCDAPGAAVSDAALLIDSTEVAARRHVGWFEREIDPRGLKHPTADVEDKRIVAEEREVSRAAARRDPGRDGNCQPAGAAPGDHIQVRRVGRLQLRAAGIRVRQAAQPVHHEEQNLCLVLLGEPTGESEVHAHSIIGYRRTGALRRPGQKPSERL